MPYERQCMLGWLNERGELLATTSLVTGLLAPLIWHIRLFVVATTLHGTGAAQEFYRIWKTGCVATRALDTFGRGVWPR